MVVYALVILASYCLAHDMCPHNKLCDGSLGVPRTKMPQFHNEQGWQFLNDHNYTCTTMHPSTLLPTQLEIYKDKVNKLIEDETCDMWPIVVAGNYVVDGHHRYAACHLTGKVLKVHHLDYAITHILDRAQHLPRE